VHPNETLLCQEEQEIVACKGRGILACVVICAAGCMHLLYSSLTQTFFTSFINCVHFGNCSIQASLRLSVFTTTRNICLLSGFRLFSTSFPRGNTQKNKVHAHVQHVRRKAKKLSPCVPYILFAFFWCRHGPVSGEGKKEENRTGGRHATTPHNTQHATRNTQHATRRTQNAERKMQHATRRTQHATRKVQGATRNTQHKYIAFMINNKWMNREY
jgi:hypothetical protein